MRKVLYGCAAAAVVTAAGAYLILDEAVRYPHSLAGRCVSAAGQLSVTLDPFTLLNQAVPRVPHAPVCCEQMPCPQNIQAQAAPPKPNKPEAAPDSVPVNEPVAEAVETIKVEEMADGFAAFSNATPEPCDEESTETVSDETREPLPVGESAAEESEPAADNGDAWPHMPYADEDEDGDTSAEETGSLISDIIQELGICNDSQASEEPSDADTDTPSTTSPAEERQTEQGHECDHGCPYTGCPYFNGYSVPATENPSESLVSPPRNRGKKVHKVKRDPLTTPSSEGAQDNGPTGLDTMEYRSSDGDAHAFENLRF